jgi:hypothetical protein
LTQEQLLAQAQTTTAVPPGGTTPHPLAVTSAVTEENGGTWPWSTREILARNGVPARLEEPTLANVAQAVAEGRGVLASLDGAVLWANGSPPGAWHVVLVTGARYDANGALEALIVNDTGNVPGRNCGVAYRAATIDSAMAKHAGAIVTTDAAVWRR